MLRHVEFDGAMAKQIAQHPNVETITDILRGGSLPQALCPIPVGIVMQIQSRNASGI